MTPAWVIRLGRVFFSSIVVYVTKGIADLRSETSDADPGSSKHGGSK